MYSLYAPSKQYLVHSLSLIRTTNSVELDMLCALGPTVSCVSYFLLLNGTIWFFSFPALVTDSHQEALEVSTALGADGFLQRHVVFLQVHVLNGLQIDLGNTGSQYVMGAIWYVCNPKACLGSLTSY